MARNFFQPGDTKCPYYSRTRDLQDDPHPRGKALMERLWNECSSYVDSNAFDHAREDMVSVFWELYLADSLRRVGVSLVEQTRTKKNQRGPDLRTEKPDVWIEAIAPTSGFGEDALSQPSVGVGFQVPIDDFVLRLRSAFEVKAKAFKKYITDGVVPVSHATVIAISGAMLPTKYSEQPIPRIVRALIAVGDQALTLDRATGKSTGSYLQHRGAVSKATGAVVKTDVFLDPAYAHVSGVIYSYADWVSVPFESGSEFMLVHNPLATVPIPRGWLNTGKEFWSDGSVLTIKQH